MKKIGIVDIAVTVAVLIALAVGFFTYMHFRQTAEKQINNTAKIMFQVFLRGVTLTNNTNPIKPGDETFITIRNVPYTKLQVVDSKMITKKIVIPNPGKTPAFLVSDDYSQFLMYDIIVSVVDIGKITNDGPVIGGNKIKMGMPITLEGMDYKFNGTVSNIELVRDNPILEKKDIKGKVKFKDEVKSEFIKKKYKNPIKFSQDTAN